MSTDIAQSTNRVVGKVKWFNNKAGYGFITMKEDDVEKDIFVHYSNINVSNSQYKYLVQGEYVEFSVSKTDGGPHEFKATEITGINGGSIMCETRRVSREEIDENRVMNPSKTNPSKTNPINRKRLDTRKQRQVGEGNVSEVTDSDGFTTVIKKRNLVK